jgi:hypothetical protein
MVMMASLENMAISLSYLKAENADVAGKVV